jgi:hypothetical protein
VMDGSNCSLCFHYYGDASSGLTWCGSCPIYKTIGRSCAVEYHKWTSSDDPEPMIRLLRKVGRA